MQRSLFLLFFLIAFCSRSQISTSFFIDGVLDGKETFDDTLQVIDYIESYKLNAISNGFYFAGIDSMKSDGELLIVYLHQGEKRKFELQGYGGKNVRKSLGRRIDYLSNRGYPFANVRIDSTWISGENIKGIAVEEKGPYIVNDSAFFFQDIKTEPGYIYHLIEHIVGEPFKETAYRKVNARINRSSFLGLRRPVDVSFQDEKAKLYLDIEENESSSFEGVLGLQQEGSGSSTVIGNLNLNVQNLFRSGKELGINWESFAGGSQELDLSYSHPFILGSRLTPYFAFDLLKQDSIFLKRSSRIDIGTYISSDLELRLGYRRSTGSLLSTNATTLANEDIADYTSELYSIKLSTGRFNQLNNRNSSQAFSTSVGLGSKRIDNNLSVADSFYDTLQLSTDLFRFDLRAVINREFFRRQQFSQELEIGIIENDELLNNERYRLGGLGSLRGFNEKFLFADKFVLSRTEFRSFFEKGSYIYLFYDQLLYRNDHFSDAPFGTGLGFLLSTLSGQFNFALAVGRSKSQPLDFSNMKAHFGYTTTF